MALHRLHQRVTPHKTTALIILAYLVLAVIMTWPLISQLDSHFPGDIDREDHWAHQWTFWWVKQAIVSGQNPLFTQLMFFPEGISLTSHNIPWLNIMAWLPLQAAFGQTAAYNLVFLATYVFNALAGYLLALDVTKSKWASFVGGVVFGFWPYTISHFDHPNLIVIGWIPLSLLYLRRTLRTNRRRDMLFTTFFLVLAGITRWQHLILAAFVLGFYVLWILITDRSKRSGQSLKRLIQIAVLSGLALLLLSAPLIFDRLSSGGTEGLLYFQTDGQVDVLAYLTPSRYHPVWGDIVQNTSLFNSFRYNTLYVPFLGFLTFLLSVIGLVSAKPKSLVWGAMAIFLAIMAMGSILRVGGELYPQIPLPFRLLEDFFLVRLVRRADRFNIVLSIPISILVSFAILQIRKRIPSQGYANGITLILTGVILFEALPWPLPMISIEDVPEWYQVLSQEEGEFAILDLPLDRISFKKYMFYQTRHGKPTVQGRVSRVPPSAYNFMDSIPFLDYLRLPNSSESLSVNVSEQLQELSAVNVSYIVVHKDLFPPSLLEDFTDWLSLIPFHEDEDLAVYRTDPQYGRDFSFQEQLLPGIGIIAWRLSDSEIEAGGTLQIHISWGTSQIPDRDYHVCFNLKPFRDNAASGHSVCHPITPGSTTLDWQINAIHADTYELFTGPSTPADYEVLAYLKDLASNQAAGSTVSLGTVSLTPPR